jgi:hypothetical protein
LKAVTKPAKKKSTAKKHPAAVALGRLGGIKGGQARAKKMTAEERSESARKAVQARWEKARATKKSLSSASSGRKNIKKS